jgi:hypothetical protein
MPAASCAHSEKAAAVHHARAHDDSVRHARDIPVERLTLQLRFMEGSESMGNHDSNIVDACRVD